MHICLAGVGVAGEVFEVREVIMFSLFLGIFLAYNWSMSHIWRLLVLFRRIGSKAGRG